MLQIKMHNFDLSISLIEGKTLDLSVSMLSNDIKDYTTIMELFSRNDHRAVFRYLADHLE